MHPERGKLHFASGFLVVLIGLSIGFAGGYGLSGLLFSVTGRPPELAANIISGLLGIITFIFGTAGIKLIGELYLRAHGKEGDDPRRQILQDTMAAIERIAKGDFKVLVPTDRRDPYHGLAESVNKMAQELGTMEQQRQDFVSNVSHEIQSPLTSIRGFAALLRNEELPCEQRDHYLTVIETESKRLSSLSENLLKLSALESGSDALAMKEYRLDKQLESAALMLEPQWSAKNIDLSLSPEIIVLNGDEELLAQVWINLLQNAIKFTPQGGKINISLTSNSENINVKITDSGIGITAEDKIHVFERFYKADKSRDRALGGNGLGLSLVKKIAELHNGSVELESEPGKGTAFTVRLPVK